MSEVPRPGPEQEPEKEEKPEWGTEEWRDYWGEELDELAEDGLPQELEDVEEGDSISIESTMRTLDPPDKRRVSELSREEKELLLRLASEWRDLPLEVSVIVLKQGQEVVVPEGEKVNPEDLVDIRFEKITEEEVISAEKREIEEREVKVHFENTCGWCGHTISVDGVVKYKTGEWRGTVTLGEETYELSVPFTREEEEDFEWMVDVPCVCISEELKTRRRIQLVGTIIKEL